MQMREKWSKMMSKLLPHHGYSMPRQTGSPSQSALHESTVWPPYLYQVYSAPVAAVQQPRAPSRKDESWPSPPLNTSSQNAT